MEAHGIFSQVGGHAWVLRINLLGLWASVSQNVHRKLSYLGLKHPERQLLGVIEHGNDTNFGLIFTGLRTLLLTQIEGVNISMYMVIH